MGNEEHTECVYIVGELRRFRSPRTVLLAQNVAQPLTITSTICARITIVIVVFSYSFSSHAILTSLRRKITVKRFSWYKRVCAQGNLRGLLLRRIWELYDNSVMRKNWLRHQTMHF